MPIHFSPVSQSKGSSYVSLLTLFGRTILHILQLGCMLLLNKTVSFALSLGYGFPADATRDHRLSSRLRLSGMVQLGAAYSASI